MRKKTKKCLRFMLLSIAALYLGLFFYCVISEAATIDGGTIELLPEAGFEEFLDTIEPVEFEYFSEPIEPTYILTDEEVDLLLRIGQLEGGIDGVDGIAHAMQVVMNRVESDRFPDSVSEVIFQSNPIQFPTADMLATANITPEAYAALDQVIFGDYQWNECHFFESCEGQIFSSWAEYVFTCGGHDFYKVKEG